MEVFEIAQSGRKQCRILQVEYEEVKRSIENISVEIRFLKVEIDICSKHIALINANSQKHSQIEIQSSYKKESEIALKLSEKMQEQSFLTERKIQLEVSLKESFETVKTAEGILENISLSLVYLTGNLLDISSQMEGLTQKYHEGIKIISAAEEERQKVAREIYNGPINRIISAENEALRCQNIINEDKNEAKRSMQSLKTLVRESVADIRKIIYNLRPMSLDDLGLATTLRRYVENFEDENYVNVTLNTIGLEREIKPIISLTAFRVVQEALENIRKHSGAKSAKVLVERKDERLVLRISDTGKGFDVEKLKEQDYLVNGGVGLFSINERLGLLEGKMDITSINLKGTTISVSIPLMLDGATV